MIALMFNVLKVPGQYSRLDEYWEIRMRDVVLIIGTNDIDVHCVVDTGPVQETRGVLGDPQERCTADGPDSDRLVL